MQELGRHNYVTATSYLELIASFRQLLTKRRQAVMEAKQRYVNGLDKLAFAESQVNLRSCSSGNIRNMRYNLLRIRYVPGTMLYTLFAVL